jgi:hypothetical protein
MSNTFQVGKLQVDELKFASFEGLERPDGRVTFDLQKRANAKHPLLIPNYTLLIEQKS